MDERIQPTVTTLQERFSAGIYEFRGEVDLIVKPEQIVDICRALRDEHGYTFLAEQTAVDYWPQEDPRFTVIYKMFTMDTNLVIGVRVPLSGNDPHMPTVTGVYPSANWQERELYDMFGITFDNHPDMRRILMPADWVGHPLRKDYPLGYEEVQFTFNVGDIDRRKPHPHD